MPIADPPPDPLPRKQRLLLPPMFNPVLSWGNDLCDLRPAEGVGWPSFRRISATLCMVKKDGYEPGDDSNEGYITVVEVGGQREWHYSR